MKNYKSFKKILSGHCIENIFITAIVLILIRSTLGLSEFDNNCFFVLTYSAYGCVAIKVLLTKYSWKEKIMSLIICLIGVITWSFSQKMVFFSNALFIIGMKGVNEKKALKIAAATITSMSLFIMFYSLIFRPDTIQSKYGLTLGFLNANGLQSFISAITILYVSAIIDKISLIKLFVILGINAFFANMTQSRTGLIIIIFWGMWILYIKYIKNKLVKVESLYLIIVAITYFILFCYYQYHYFTKINRIISGRLHQASYYITKYGITLWGSYLEELEPDYQLWHNLLDCGYARLLINYGLICGVLFIYLHFKALRIARLKKDLCIQSVLIGFALLMVTENGGIGINFNMSLLVLNTVLFGTAVYNKDIFIGSVNYRI